MTTAQPQSLPPTMVMLAYLAAGSALSCSWLMLRQVLDQKATGLTGGEVIGWLLPSAILFGAAVLARMTGHLTVRATGVGLALVASAWLYLEGISIYTSYISVNVALETRQASERNSTVTAQASNRSQQAVSQAISELTSAMENMPESWITRRQQASRQLSDLVQQQRALADMNHQQATGMSSTLTDAGQKQWSLLIAIALSVVVLGVQFGLGVTSDGAQRQKTGFLDDFLSGGGYQPDDDTAGGMLPAKKSRGLEVVK